MSPEGVYNRIHHLINCSFANIVILEVFFGAISSANYIQDLLNWSTRDSVLNLIDHVMTNQANRIYCFQ